MTEFGYPLPQVPSVQMTFQEKEIHYGETIEMLCAYRPRGPHGPRFCAVATYDSAETGPFTRKEYDKYRGEFVADALDSICAQVREHNACVEAWPT